MAPYGDPKKYDLSSLVSFKDGELRVNTKLVNVVGLRRYKENGKGYYFTPELVKWLGPKRQGDEIDDPRSEEHTSELQSLMRISYAVFCLKKTTPTVNKT